MADVDEKVVQMRFENSQFEQGAAKSMGTLDKLKTALKLDGATKGFSDIDKAAQNLKLDSIASGVEMLEKRFSALGIVGMTVLQNLTNSAVNTAKQMASTVQSTIFTGGKNRAMNLEQANFMFKGLKMDVEKAMAAANNAVSGTAYGLDQAARAAAQFGASGMKAGKDMETALTAISGVAAMTNSSYDDIANIFTTVSAQGRLMGDQLLQLSVRGLNVSADLAKAMGKSQSEIREMVSKGKIDFETFYKAMYNAYAAQAKRANDTFSGALSNTKAALSRIGADFMAPFYSQARKVLLRLMDLFNMIRKSSENFVKAYEKVLGLVRHHVNKMLVSITKNEKAFRRVFNAMARILKGFYNLIMHAVVPAVRRLVSSFKEFFGGIDPSIIKTLSVNFMKFWRAFRYGEDQLFVMNQAFEDFFRILKSGLNVIVALGRSLGAAFLAAEPLILALGDSISKGFHIISMSFSSVAETLVELMETSTVLQMINTGMQFAVSVATNVVNIFVDLWLVAMKAAKILSYFGEVIAYIANGAFELFGEQINAVLGFIDHFIDRFTLTTEQVQQFTGPVTVLSEVFKTLWEVIRGIGSVGVTLLTSALQFLTQAIDAFADSATPFVDEFLAFTNGLAEGLTSENYPQKVRELFDAFNDQIKNGFPSFGQFVSDVTSGFDSLKQRIDNGESIADILGDGLEALKTKAAPVKEFAENVISTLGEMFNSIGIQLPSIENIIEKFPEGVREKLEPLIDLVKDIAKGFKDFFKGIGEALTPAEDDISDSVDNIQTSIDPLTKVFNFLKSIVESVLDVFGRLLGNLDGIGEMFSETFSNLGEVFGRAIDDMDYETFLDAFNSGMFAGLVISFKNFVESFSSTVEGFDTKSFQEKIESLLGSVGDTLSAFQGKLKADTLKTIAVSVAILAASLLLLAMIQPEALAKGLLGITVLFLGLQKVFLSLTKVLTAGGLGAIKDIAVMFLGLSVSVFILAGAVKMLSALSWSEIIKGLGTVGAIIGGLYLIGTKGGIQHLYTGTAKAMIMLAASMGVMAISLKILSSIPFDNLKTGLLGMAGALGIMAGFAYLMESTKIDDSMAKNLIGVGAAMIVMAAGLGALSLIPADKIIPALAALGGALLIVSAALIAIDKLASPKAAASLLLVSVAMGMLVPPFMLLSTMSFEGILTSILALVAALGTLTLFAGIAQLLSAGFITLSATMLSMGAGFFMAGTGAALFGASLIMIAAAGLPAVGVLLALIGGLIALIPALFASLGGGIVAFITSIGNGAQAIGVAFTQIVAMIGTVLMTAVPMVIAIGMAIIDGFLQAVVAHMPSIMANGLAIILMFMQGLAIGLPLIVEQGAMLVISFINGLTTALTEHSGELAAALGGLIQAVLGALVQLIMGAGAGILGGLGDLLGGIFTSVGAWFLDLGQNIGNWLIETLGTLLGFSPEAIEAAKSFFGDFINAAKDTIMNLPDILAGGINDALGFFGIPPIFEEKGDEAGEELASGIEESEAPQEAIDEKMNEIGSETDLSSFGDMGGDIMEKINEGMSNVDMDFDFGDTLNTDLSSAITDTEGQIPDFTNLGIDMTEATNTGMENGADFSNIMTNLMGDAKSEGESKAGEFTSVGNQAVNGMASGARSNGEFSSAVREIVRDGLAAGKDEAKVKSPSRLFRDELGVYIPAGMAKGVDKASYLLEEATKGVVDNSLNSAKEAFSKYGDLLTNDVDVNPVITPVMDLSQVEAGSKSIAQMMAENSNYALSGGLGSKIDLSGATVAAAQINAGVNQAKSAADDLSDVIGAIKQLGSNIENMPQGETNIINGLSYQYGTEVSDMVSGLTSALRIDRRS